MERQRIETLVRQWIEVGVAKGETSVFDALMLRDATEIKTRAEAVFRALARIEVEVEALVVEGEHIAWRWRLSGDHVAPFRGLEPTGRRIELRGVNFQRLESGKVAEHWTMSEVLAR